MNTKLIMSLDQGTTSSRAVLFNHKGEPVEIAQQDFEQIFPEPGWVEHNPIEIWESQISSAKKVLNLADASNQEVVAIGITNQRETTVVWDKNTGEPIYNAIVWQDRRTAKYCDELKANGKKESIKEKTGLPVSLAEDPLTCVVRGCGTALENITLLRQVTTLS